MEQVTDFMKSQRSPEKMMTLGVNYCSYGSGMQMKFKYAAWIAKVQALKLVVARRENYFYEIKEERVS